jgi:hypothetical protein
MKFDSATGKLTMATSSGWGLVSIENTGTDPTLVLSDQANDPSPIIFTASGELGFNTPVPTNDIHITDGSNAGINFTKTGANAGTFQIYNDGFANIIGPGSSPARRYAFYDQMGAGNGGNTGFPPFTNFNDVNTGMYFPTNNDVLAIVTGGVDRIRFAANGDITMATTTGNVGIATTSPPKPLSVHGESLLMGSSTMAAITMGSSTMLLPNLAALEVTSDFVCRVAANGKLVFQTANCTASAARLKHNIRPLDLDSSKIKDLVAKSWEFNSNDKTGHGFVADDVVKVYPEIVTYNEKGEIQNYDQNVLITLLVDYLQKHEGQGPQKEGFNPGWAALVLAGGAIIISLCKKPRHSYA